MEGGEQWLNTQVSNLINVDYNLSQVIASITFWWFFIKIHLHSNRSTVEIDEMENISKISPFNDTSFFTHKSSQEGK